MPAPEPRCQHPRQCAAFTCDRERGRAAGAAVLVGNLAGVLAAVHNLGPQDLQARDVIRRPNGTLVTLEDLSAGFEPLEPDVGGTLDLTGEFGQVTQSYLQGLNSPLDHRGHCKGRQKPLARYLLRHPAFFFFAD